MEFNPVLTFSFALYSLGIILLGLYSTRLRKKTADDFVLANRELGPWASSLSASASSESGWVMLGLVGEAYLNGAAAFWIVPGIAAGYIANWYFVAERLRKYTVDTNAVTLTQYILNRFGPRSATLRFVSAIIIALAMLGYVAAQMNAAGKAFDAVFSLPYWLGVVAGAAIILAYTVTGGFRAIAWTDIIQALFMVVALIIMPFVMLSHIGGYSEFLTQVQQTDPNLLSFSYDKTGFVLLGFIIGSIGIGLGYPGLPHVLARFMAAKDYMTIKRGRIIALTWMVLVYVGAVYFGIFSRIQFGVLEDPEQALPYAVSQFLPPVLGGFVIAAIVAAICSTADSQLIVVSTTISRDIVPYFRNRGSRYDSNPGDIARILSTRRLDQWVLVILAAISMFFALTENRVIFEFVLYAWSALGASFGPLVLLGLFWPRASKAGAIAGMITGAGVTILWRNIAALKGIIYELVPAFILALAAVIVFSILLPDTSRNSETRSS